MTSQPSHPILLVLLLAIAAAGCNKEFIEEQCEHAAIQKCGSTKSYLAKKCRQAVMGLCVKKLCNLPFNNCDVPAGDPLCATDEECNEPDDATYPDDNTWSYCGPDGTYYHCDGEECTASSDECPV
jgi:hypothetical protein